MTGQVMGVFVLLAEATAIKVIVPIGAAFVGALVGWVLNVVREGVGESKQARIVAERVVQDLGEIWNVWTTAVVDRSEWPPAGLLSDAQRDYWDRNASVLLIDMTEIQRHALNIGFNAARSLELLYATNPATAGRALTPSDAGALKEQVDDMERALLVLAEYLGSPSAA